MANAPTKRKYRQQDHMREQGDLRASVVARILKMHHSAVYRILDAKVVKEMRVGGSRYVQVASLREYLGEAADTFDLPAAVG